MTTETTEYREANADIEAILGATRPKHIGEGLASGIGIFLQGAVKSVEVAVLTPTVSIAEGQKEMGIVGGILGGIGGAVGGVVQAANIVGGSIVGGAGQVIRGIASTPEAAMAPSKGNWWNPHEGRWVKTNLLEEERWIKTQPKYDEDILGEDVVPEDERPEPRDDLGNPSNVKDTYYYDLLGLHPSVDSEMIKRRYFIIARKYSPDRAGANPKAQEQFKQIGHAYMVLMNEELRAKYDRVGRDGLWKEEEEDGPPDVDPNVLFTLLFGSEKFDDYIGKLSAATSARVGEEQNAKISLKEARLLQRRRVTRLAISLSKRLQNWAEDDLEKSAIADWMTEADYLCDASYGADLVHVIGKVYTVSAVQFLGSMESGIGMPSISKWAKKQLESLKGETRRISSNVKKVAGDQDKIAIKKEVGRAIEKSEGDKKMEQMAKDILKKSFLHSKALEMMWTRTVVDITNTINEAAHMVLHDQNVVPEVRKKRGEALFAMGEIFEKANGASKAIPEQEELEKVAFHALLETVWNQEALSRGHEKELDGS